MTQDKIINMLKATKEWQEVVSYECTDDICKHKCTLVCTDFGCKHSCELKLSKCNVYKDIYDLYGRYCTEKTYIYNTTEYYKSKRDFIYMEYIMKNPKLDIIKAREASKTCNDEYWYQYKYNEKFDTIMENIYVLRNMWWTYLNEPPTPGSMTLKERMECEHTYYHNPSFRCVYEDYSP